MDFVNVLQENCHLEQELIKHVSPATLHTVLPAVQLITVILVRLLSNWETTLAPAQILLLKFKAMYVRVLLTLRNMIRHVLNVR